MRSCRLFAVVLLFASSLSIAAFGSELTIKVVDPAAAVVSGARVEIFARNSSRPVAIEVTSAQGAARFSNISTGELRIHVLAPGFAEKWQSIAVAKTDQHSEATIALQLAVATETVVVSATRTPVPSDLSGAALSTLTGGELETVRPVAANDAIRFLPGAVVNTAGQRGGLSSLFVRGGESRYNKVIVDGVSVTQPGGTFDFGTLPVYEADRLEFLRGTTSTLYGSDAMTSVVQLWSATGKTSIPELRFGADGGNYGTANGYASLAGANGRFDYDIFANQFNTSGSGPNADYSNSLQGGNLGAKLNDWASMRLRIRHDHSVTGVPGAWNFNGGNVFDVDGMTYTLLPDLDQRVRQNNFLSSLDLAIKSGARWQHHFSGYEFNLNWRNIDNVTDPGHDTPFGNLDSPFEHLVNINRAGFAYQGEYTPRSWAQTVTGYDFEDENGSVTDTFAGFPPTVATGLRLNHAVYVEQRISYGRLTGIAGVRFVHNPTFGNTGVPRVSLAYRVLRGGERFSGTRLKASFATGIKEPRFEEAYGNGPFQIPNPHLKAERNRALEAGVEQELFSNKLSFTATYFNNLFHDQIEFITVDPSTFVGRYVNLEKSLAHGAEAVLDARVTSRVSWSAAYTYTSTQILLSLPGSFSPFATGDPLLRRPHHSATTRLSYLGSHWGSTLSGSFVGRRPDSDFEGFDIDHAPGYVRVDTGGWYAVRPRITLYANVENLLDRSYQEVTGYPALGVNFRAGVRFRVGGE